MKARFRDHIYTDSQINEQIEKFVNEKYDKVAVDISAQLLSVVILTLDKEYGFREKRLKTFIKHLQGEAQLISLEDIMGKKVDTQECIKYIKEKYGIDLVKELSVM